jgi:hypothetical protein
MQQIPREHAPPITEGQQGTEMLHVPPRVAHCGWQVPETESHIRALQQGTPPVLQAAPCTLHDCSQTPESGAPPSGTEQNSFGQQEGVPCGAHPALSLAQQRSS